MRTEQENPIDIKLYPPENRFMVTFQSVHLLMDRELGFAEYTTQNQRRFILADSANDAREFFRLGELANKAAWDGKFHAWKNLESKPVPTAATFTFGYFRFYQDCRKIQNFNATISPPTHF